MKRGFGFGLGIVSLIVAIAVASRFMQQEAGPESHTLSIANPAADAAQALRRHFFSYDFEAGAVYGRSLFSQYPAPEVGAWYVLNAARNKNEEEALQVAERLLEADDSNPWAQFALAAALIWNDERGEDALAASAKALEHSPENIDFLWLRAETLRLRQSKDQAIDLLDAHRAALDKSAELLVVKGAALYDKSLQSGVDHETRDNLRTEALQVFSRARQVDPASTSSYYTAAWFLTTSRRMTEAYPLYKIAADLSTSPRVHVAFWDAVQGYWELSAEQKRTLIVKDMDGFVERRAEYPSTLALAVEQAQRMGLNSKREELETRFLKHHSESPAVERLLMGRIEDVYQDIRTNRSNFSKSRGVQWLGAARC